MGKRGYQGDPRIPYLKVQVLSFYGRQCYYCKRGLAAREITLDHVIPIAIGGQTIFENLVPACEPCNSRKGKSE